MATIPFAISVHHFISSVGADVGFASIIGLAILVLLYFSQARETANLREQAYEANQRVSQLEARLTTMARQQQQAAAAAAQPAAAQPAAARVGNQSAAAGARRNPFRAPALVGATAVAPGPPAGVAAPALTAATKLIPTDPVVSEPFGADVPDPLELTSYSGPPPATAAGGSNGVSNDAVAAAPPPRVTPPPARAAQQAQRGGRGTQPPGSRSGTQPPRGPERRRSRAGLRFGLLIGALAVAGVVVALVLITKGSSSSSSTSTQAATNTPTARRVKTAAKVNPANVTVTVLNGTATAGLADRVATQLTGVGYKQGNPPANASDQTRTATVVAYMPGHKNDALAVARSLKLGPSSVQSVDSSTRAVACPGTATCTAQVVVTVGSDLSA